MSDRSFARERRARARSHEKSRSESASETVVSDRSSTAAPSVDKSLKYNTNHGNTGGTTPAIFFLGLDWQCAPILFRINIGA